MRERHSIIMQNTAAASAGITAGAPRKGRNMKRSFRETRNAEAESPKTRDTDGREELINKYSGMSEDGLMRELRALTDKQRAEGSFDKGLIERKAEAILPLLSEDQRKKLFQILGSL